ncbi:unnamed protein product [Mytilus coruscus]|uniref:F-box domain-containing protein n=1 Tax=Mytilus coruscus TaxID=42192 RepID=A0A6J8BN98_MYTCO|nr:unnamed protein product [Mytilus coruscus]
MTEKDNCHLLPILDLPDVPLIRIFFFLDLEDLVLVVNRVCQRFYHLIKSTPVLWRVFEFYWPQIIKEEDLPYIFRHSKSFRVFNIGYCTYTGRLSVLDYSFISNLSCARKLTWLNLTRTSISSTCFLQYLPNLEILDLSDCHNLNDCDFHVVSQCHKLQNLYLSFDKVNPKTIKDIVSCTPQLETLDICVSRNAKDFDTIEQIDEVSSHQGEGNVNNITGEQNLEKIEEQNEETTEEQNDETSFDTNANDEKMRSRKRKKQSELWKQNLRKKRRQSGMEYINTRGNTQRKREVKIGTKDCNGGCRFKCSKNISETERKAIFKTFWS